VASKLAGAYQTLTNRLGGNPSPTITSFHAEWSVTTRSRQRDRISPNPYGSYTARHKGITVRWISDQG
jgi:hypothetical protein